MRRLIALLLALLACNLMAAGENNPKGEFFGGYSYLKADTSRSNVGMHGFHFSFTDNVNRWVGGLLDVSSHFSSVSGDRANTQAVMLGPQFAYRKSASFTPAVHALAGVMHGSNGFLGNSTSGTHFAFGLGGSLDFNVGKNVAIRVVQGDYLASRFQDLQRHNIRVSTGLVYRWGAVRGKKK